MGDPGPHYSQLASVPILNFEFMRSSPPPRMDVTLALGRAIWNLLDNAVKYSPECKTLEVEVVRDAQQVAVRVRDRGIDIPPALQKEIFKEFVRGGGAATAAVRGTGIGLAMVDHIVRAHGGKIVLDSEPRRGSTFTVLLPAERAA